MDLQELMSGVKLKGIGADLGVSYELLKEWGVEVRNDILESVF